MANITNSELENEKVNRVTFEKLFQDMNWFGKLFFAAFVAFQGWMALELYELNARVEANTASLKFMHESVNLLRVDMKEMQIKFADMDKKMDRILLLLGEGAQP